MRILYVCHRLPYPPKRGGKIRPFHMIEHLARTHEVHVASLARSASEAEEGAGLSEYCHEYHAEIIENPIAWARMITRLPTPAPSSFGYFHSPRLKRVVHDWLRVKRFDLIFVHCSSVAAYVADVNGVPKILDFGDMDSQKWLDYRQFKPWPVSWGYWLEGAKLESVEKRLARAFDMATCTTRAELQTLRSYGVATRTGWFPNGVDHRYFTPAADAYDQNLICFVGRMDYYPNQQAVFSFCRDILPLIQERRPDARFIVVGAEPPRRVRALSQQRGVSVTGSVADVRPFVQSAAVAVAPLQIARGTQNKILESLAMGVPVVASQVACNGIDAVPGEHLLSANDPAEFAASVLRLLDDRRLRTRLSIEGRNRVLTHHSWERSMALLDDLIEDCVGKSPVGR